MFLFRSKVVFLGLFFSVFCFGATDSTKLYPRVVLDLENPLDTSSISELSAWVSAVKTEGNRRMLDDKNGVFAQQDIFLNLDEDSFRSKLSFFVSVRPVKNLSNTYAILFYSRNHMNKALIRSSLFRDGGKGITVGTLPSYNSIYLHESIEACRGLRSSFAEENRFINFLCDADFKPSFEERVFYFEVLAEIYKKFPMDLRMAGKVNFEFVALNVIGFSLDTLGHELAHVLYNSNNAYKKIIQDYWVKEISKSEKSEVRRVLGDAGYDVINENNLINEFQAFLLQPKIGILQSEMLDFLVPKHYVKLLRKIRSSGIAFPVPSEAFHAKDVSLHLNLSPRVQAALDYSVETHGGQPYGLHNYRYHLERVIQVLHKYGISDEDTLMAAAGHDLYEDKKIPREVLEEKFGKAAADAIWAVSLDDGQTRAEKYDKVYAKIRSNVIAYAVKLADRITNTEESIHAFLHNPNNSKDLLRYINEAEIFKNSLKFKPLWERSRLAPMINLLWAEWERVTEHGKHVISSCQGALMVGVSP